MRKQKGFFWHVHHDILIEWCHSYNERAEYIKSHKAKSEQELRLRLFQPIKGALPQEIIDACQICERKWQAYEQTWWEICERKWQAYERAQQAYERALKKHWSVIIALHKIECPNCPWNGKTIFS